MAFDSSQAQGMRACVTEYVLGWFWVGVRRVTHPVTNTLTGTHPHIQKV